MVFLRHAPCLRPLVWDLFNGLARGAQQIIKRQADSGTHAAASAPAVLLVVDARHDLLLREGPFLRVELRVGL